MKEKAYHEDVNIKNELHLRELLAELPPFCKQFFIGIEATTASRTRIAYAYDLACFFDYLHENNPTCKKMKITEFSISILDKITPMDIEEYLYHLKLYEKDGVAHTNDDRGLKLKLASLRTFYNYFFKKELIETNPAVKVDMPKIHEKAIVRLDVDEIVQLLDEVESGESLTTRQQMYHQRTKNRDLALLTLLLGTGIRVSECVGLNLSDVDLENNAFLANIFANHSVPFNTYKILARNLDDTTEWNYILTQADADDFMKKFVGFHDSTLEKIVYSESDSSAVANAIFDGTSAIMLSGECAQGEYPVECVKVMDKIARKVEPTIRYWRRFEFNEALNLTDVEMKIAYSACILAKNMEATAIVAYTNTGDSARRLSGLGAGCPILAITDNRKTFNQLGLVWNVYPVYVESRPKVDDIVESGIIKLKEQGILEKDDLVVVSGGAKLLKKEAESKIACGIIKI